MLSDVLSRIGVIYTLKILNIHYMQRLHMHHLYMRITITIIIKTTAKIISAGIAKKMTKAKTAPNISPTVKSSSANRKHKALFEHQQKLSFRALSPQGDCARKSLFIIAPPF